MSLTPDDIAALKFGFGTWLFVLVGSWLLSGVSSTAAKVFHWYVPPLPPCEFAATDDQGRVLYRGSDMKAAQQALETSYRTRWLDEQIKRANEQGRV